MTNEETNVTETDTEIVPVVPFSTAQLEVRWMVKKIKNQPLWASEFREMLAREGDAHGLPAELFRSPDGHTTPPVHVIGARGWVGLVGSGEFGVSLVNAVIPAVLRILQQQLDAPVPMQLFDHTKGMIESQYSKQYWIREMVYRRRRQRTPPTESELLERLQPAITRDLYRAAGWRWEPGKKDSKLAAMDKTVMGMDVPVLEVDVLDIHRPRGLQIVTSDGLTGEYATLVDVLVGINAKLEGVWQVGALQARGYGRILHKPPLLSITRATDEKGVIQ